MNVQKNKLRLKRNDHVINWTFLLLEPLQIRISVCVHAQILAMTNHRIQINNLVLNDVFNVMIPKPFYFDLSRKKFCQKIFSKNYVIKWWKRKRFKNCRFHIPTAKRIFFKKKTVQYNQMILYFLSRFQSFLSIFAEFL